MGEQLLQCGHCGNDAVREFEPDRIARFRVGCVACAISTSWCYTEKIAEDRWNRRTPTAAPPVMDEAMVERLAIWLMQDDHKPSDALTDYMVPARAALKAALGGEG